MSGAGGRQVTAVITHSGEPLRTLHSCRRPDLVRSLQLAQLGGGAGGRGSSWGGAGGRGSSCDTTPATPESLLTDSCSPDTDLHFARQYDHCRSVLYGNIYLIQWESEVGGYNLESGVS